MAARGGVGRHRAITVALALAVSPVAHAQTLPSSSPGLPVAPASAAPGEDGQWPMPAKNYASTRYSELDQVNGSTVKDLQVVFTFATGGNRGEEAAPIVVDNTLYIVTAYPNVLYALDLTRPGATLKWSYEPHPDPASQGFACCDVVNRGAAYDNGRLFFNTLDGTTIAVDAKTGNPVWKTKLGDITTGETITMAPIVAKGKVIVGNSGGEMGVRGWVSALDAGTGKIAWKAYATGPDKDVLIGSDFHPFYDSEKGQDLGVKSWPPEAWRIGGGTMWGWVAFDPELNLIYYGTANPGPWNQEQRPGDNKWTAGVFARDVDTGAAKWFDQYNPHDQHGYGGINEHVLLDVPLDGKIRKVLLHPDRNGYLYVIDRTNGEMLSAETFAFVNSVESIDLKTSRPTVNPEKATKLGSIVHDVCPTASGAKNWNPGAYSPRTGLLYIPHDNLCMDWENVPANYIAGTPYVGANVAMKAGPGGNRGQFTAWDILKQRPAWQIKEDLPLWSAALVTAGDLVFYGTLDGWFKAVDARSGGLKWQFRTDSGIIGQPIAYQGPDGREYIAVLAGVGGWAGAVVSGHLDPRDPTAALGFVGVTSDLRSRTMPGGKLYVFALPQT